MNNQTNDDKGRRLQGDQYAETSKPRGPEPERLKIDGKWEDAVDKALRKEKPKEGWSE